MGAAGDRPWTVEGAIPEDHTVHFAVTFYWQPVEGLSVQAAFDLAGLQLGDLTAQARPQLFHAAGIAPAAVTFADGRGG